MAYFYVLVKLGAASSPYEKVLTDVSESELRHAFVTKYKNGADILIDGRLIKISDISSVLIVRTKECDEITRQRINSDSLDKISKMNSESDGIVFISAGSGYDPEDILELGENVTSEYITEPPGSGGGINWGEIANHPWVITILGGLVLAAILALLGIG